MTHAAIAEPELVTKDQNILFVNSHYDPDLEERLRKKLQTKNLEVRSVDTGPREKDSICKAIASGSFDLVLLATGFLGHATQNSIVASCKKARTPYVRVLKGRPEYCVQEIYRTQGLRVPIGIALENTKTLPSAPALTTMPTQDQRLLFVTNRADPELQNRLRFSLQTRTIEWGVIEGRGPRALASLNAAIESKKFDAVLVATGFMQHATQDSLAQSCHKAGVDFIRVNKGRPSACVIAVEKFYRGSSSEEIPEVAPQPQTARTALRAPRAPEPSRAKVVLFPPSVAKGEPVAVPTVERKKPGIKAGMSPVRWGAAELLRLEILHKEKTALEIREKLREEFGTDRTVRTIHQTYSQYFGGTWLRRGLQGKEPTFPTGYAELKKAYTDAQNRSEPSAEIVLASSPLVVVEEIESPKESVAIVPFELPVVPVIASPVVYSSQGSNEPTEGSEELDVEREKITARTLRLPILDTLAKHRGPQTFQFVVEHASALVGRIADRGTPTYPFSNAGTDLRERGCLKIVDRNWEITELGLETVETRGLPEKGRRVNHNFPPVPSALVEVAPPSPPPPVVPPPVVPVAVVKPGVSINTTVAEGVEVTVTGRSGTMLVETKRSLAEILAFLLQ